MTISAVLLFGPLHGKVVELTAVKDLSQPLVFMEMRPPTFQQMAEDDRTSPIASERLYRHIYTFHEVYEQGVEEVAVLFHSEDCCDKTYADKPEERNPYA